MLGGSDTCLDPKIFRLKVSEGSSKAISGAEFQGTTSTAVKQPREILP